MEDGFFSYQLRKRLHVDGNPVKYRSLQRSTTSLQDVTTTLLGCQDRSKYGGTATLYSSIYSALLSKQTILKHLHLLCSAEELVEDVPYAYGECKNICLAVNNFNMICSSLNAQDNLLQRRCQYFNKKNSPLKEISFSEISEVCIEGRARSVAYQLIKDCSVKNALQLAEFESSFMMAFVGIVVTFTGTTSTKGSKKATPSDDHFGFYSAPLSESTNMSWKNYLITGHQTANQRALWKNALYKLWSKVTLSLSCWTRSGQSSEDFMSNVSLTSSHKGLELHPEVASCLRYVMSAQSLGQNLEKWDCELQCLLGAHLTMRRDYNYRKIKEPCTEMSTFLKSDVFKELYEKYEEAIDEIHLTLDKTTSILLHVDIMKQANLQCDFLRTLIHHIICTIIFCLGSNMQKWNLPNLAWLIMTGLPTLDDNVKVALAMMQYLACPRLEFPGNSNFHSITCRNKRICDELHHNVEFLQDGINHFYVLFQENWQGRCGSIIPTVKVLKKASNRRKRDNLSNYREAIKDELKPIITAALTLPESQQTNFVHIMLTIFYIVLRKTVTSNKAFLEPCVADKLLDDLHYLQDWLTSEDRCLNRDTCQLIHNLPIVLEIERGLQRICGKACEDTDNPSQLRTCHVYQKFPVLSTIALHSDKDWDKT